MAGTKKYKQMAAEQAVMFIQDGMRIGLGSGSTVKFALEKIGELIRSGKLMGIAGVPSSKKTEKLAKKLGIPLTSLDDSPVLDITIDGADQVDPQLNLIKGGGGALLREKILIQASKRVIIIVDERKLSRKLGSGFPVPLEVLPFAVQSEWRYVETLRAKVSLRKTKINRPFKTDQNNYILDADFGAIKHPEELVAKLGQRAGILEHGLFLDLASDVIVAGKKGLSHLKRYEVL